MQSKLIDNIWKMYVFRFLVGLHFVGGVLIPFFTDWGGISFTQIMLLQSFFVFSMFVLEVPTGAVADRWGHKSSVAAGAMFAALGALIYSSYPIYALFFVGEFCWALGGALMSGADEAIVYETLKSTNRLDDSKSIFSRSQSFGLGALVISAPIGSWIAASFGLQFTMRCMVLPIFAAALLALTFQEPSASHDDKPGYFETVWAGLGFFKNHRELKILAFDMISVSSFAFFVIWTYQPLLQQLGLPIIYFGFVHSAMTSSEIIVLNSFGRLERWFGSSRRYLTGSALLSAGAYLVLSMADSLWICIPAMIVVAGFGLSRQVLFQTYMNRHIESSNRATVISTVSMIRRLTGALLYPLVGTLVDWSLRGTFVALGMALILCVLLSGVKDEHVT